MTNIALLILQFSILATHHAAVSRNCSTRTSAALLMANGAVALILLIKLLIEAFS